MAMESRSSNVVVLRRLLCSGMEILLAEAAIVVAKSLACSLLMMNVLPEGMSILLKEPDAIGRISVADLHDLKKPGPENTDGSETEDDEEDDEDGAEEQDDDEDDEEEAPGEDGEDEGDPEDEPEANGEGESGDEDDDEDDDGDEEGEDEEEDEDEEDEEDEEETPQPPTKKRK